jgi:hypothetical protein
LQHEEIHILYCPPNVIKKIKSRRMRWAGHVARMEEEKKSAMFWWESPKERCRSKDQGIDRRMGSGWILYSLAGESGFSWLGIGIGSRLL